MGKSQTSIGDRAGLFFFLAVQAAFSSFQSLQSFHEERVTVNRERNSRMYRTSSYVVAKTIIETPVNMIGPLILATLAFFLSGCDAGESGGKFGVYLLIMLMANLVAQSFAVCMSAATPSLVVAQILTPIAIVLFFLMGGFYRNTDNIPAPFKYTFEYISFIR